MVVTQQDTIQWLKDHKVYYKFKYNVFICGRKYHDLEGIFSEPVTGALIWTSFDWNQTYEGRYYWKLVSKMFQKWYKKTKYEL